MAYYLEGFYSIGKQGAKSEETKQKTGSCFGIEVLFFYTRYAFKHPAHVSRATTRTHPLKRQM